jgi:hypothetical protein
MSRSLLDRLRRWTRAQIGGSGAPIGEFESLLLVTALLAALVLFVAQAASANAATRRPAAPALAGPADGAHVQALPSFAWQRSARAVAYEFQLSADPAFESIVNGQAGGFQTVNTFATVDKAAADGTYYWRVRAIDQAKRAGRWSRTRRIVKSWTAAPTLVAPGPGATIAYPTTPLVLRWTQVPGAYKYLVNIATDPSMGHSVLGTNGQGIETSGPVFSPPSTLAVGRYYWTVTPLDAEKHPGARSSVSSFDWVWRSRTTARVSDAFTVGDPENRVMDPQFSWDPVPGAASYQVEVNPSEDWAVGSKVCCDETATGTSMSPLALLPNNSYYWRLRAVDPDGNAGAWNVGPVLKKGFDDVAPPLSTVTGLRVRDNVADSTPPAGPTGLPTTDSPVVEWNPVVGASSYEVQIAPWDGFCDWTATVTTQPTATTATTSATSWTPLGFTIASRPLGAAGPLATTSLWKLWQDESYCVRVRARTDRDAKLGEIVSDWTQIDGLGNPAFHYSSRFPSGCTGASAKTATPASAYHEPASGSFTSRMPLFTWDWVPGACGYFVAVARDAAFTKVVDVAFTNYPAYAPRGPLGPLAYTDETTSYYWAVMPTRDANGQGLSTQPQEDSPQTFQKRSAPPTLLSPTNGANVTTQPSFHWTGTEGALDYRIQVDDDPTFGNPIDDVKTHSTTYTSTKTYPADTVLYWRVRADAENGASSGTAVGLDWSATGTFRRRLPIPVPSAGNPAGGEVIPVLTWSPVTGAVSYDMHVEQADGTKRDFSIRSSAFTPTAFYGTGVWRWQVRANFRSGFTNVAGGYSPLVPFTRHIATPIGLQTSRANGGALLSWQAAPMAKQYRVQISSSDSFSTLIDQATVDGTSFAPHMNQPQYAVPGKLYWRVAVVDEGNNTGGWASAPLRSPLPLRAYVSGTLRHRHTGRLRVTVTDARGYALAHASVTATGQGVARRTARTGRRGTATLRLRPRSRGVVTVRVSLRGYVSWTVTVRVR